MGNYVHRANGFETGQFPPETWRPAVLFSRRLREVRQLRRLTQEEVAYRAGIAVYTYRRLERIGPGVRQRANPTLDTLLRVAAALQVDPSVLLTTRPLAGEQDPRSR
ncbi:helix-turn-helix transcriptional regulator [Microbacterium sp. SLBN-146]|uniref:helix-turn-helix domain-containing protein n=1 Tax=Microbacterium sp. SLBN-146 TaxID=2768457 RepID=UPI0011534F12